MLTTTDRDVFELQETTEQFLFQMKEMYVTSLKMEFTWTIHGIEGRS